MKGFTLIETLVSMSIATLVTIFMLTIFPSVQKGMRLSEHHAAAAMLARGRLDAARAAAFGQRQPYSGSHDSYLYSVDVATPSKGLEAIKVTVRWKEASGDRTLIVETAVTQQ